MCIAVSWWDAIVIFNSLLVSIEKLREDIESDSLGDDELYEAEEQLNDYTTVLARLFDKYKSLPEEAKSELPKALIAEIRRACG